MKVKVLNYFNYDTGELMNTFVFKAEADIKKIAKEVEEIFRDEEGTRPYITIIHDLYGHLLVKVLDTENIDW